MAATHARCTLARDCSCAAARPWQTSRAGGPRPPTSALRAGAWAACLPPPPGPAPEAETGDEVTRGGGGCEINTSGWTSSPNFRVACRLLEHGAASRGNMAGLPLFETDAMGERERHPNLGSLRSDSRSSFFASYRSIAAFLEGRPGRSRLSRQTQRADTCHNSCACDTCRLRRPPTTKIQFP